MGACLSKQEDLFDKLVLESIFLDFLIRNIEVDNDWEGSAEAIEDGLQFVSPDQLTKMDYDGNLIAVPSTDTNVTVALISDSTQKATYCLKRGNAFMYAPYHSINQTVSITFSNSNNKSKTIIVGNRKHLLATFASVNKTKGKTLSQLETCVSTPLGDVLKTNSIFADLGVQEYDFIQPFIHWRYIERNSKVFSVEPYEDLDLVLGMHILVDGSCVILDDPKEPGGVSSEGNSGKQPRGNAANKRPSNKTGQLLVDTPDASPDPSACATEVRMIRTEAVESPLPIPSQDINKTDAINNNGPPSPAQQVSAASSAADPPSATGDQDLKAMITDVLSLKDVSADEGSPQQPHNSSPKRQSDTGGKGKKKPHSHIHRGPLHACFHSLTRCLPCFGGKASNIVYAADGTINYHGMKLGIQKEENNSLNNSIYAASVYTGESEYVAYGATSGLSPVTPTGSKGLFSGFSQKNNNADLKFKRLSSKKVIGGPAANHAGGHQKAVREQDPMSFQGRIPNVGNIYNKGSVLGPELSLIKNNVVQMSRIETLERSVFAVLTPSSLDRIEESGQMGESIVRSLRRNWRVKLLHKLKKTVPFLCDINHSEMAVLAKKVTLHTFTAPDVIYTQGDTSNMFYIVVHGHVGVSAMNKL